MSGNSIISKTSFPKEETAAGFLPLLGDLERIPKEYIRDVAVTKRALERWVGDHHFRNALMESPEKALARWQIPLSREQIWPFVNTEEALRLNAAIADGDTGGYPSSVTRYRAFIREKIRDRRSHRLDNKPDHDVMGRWWWRQLYRVTGQLGPRKGDGIVHTPVAFELTRGCSMRCWFCALRAGRLEAVWRHTPENAAKWQSSLEILREVIGPGIRTGICYWATEPLDNPDYEEFLGDFHRILQGCPQTTTARASADIERTRRLLRFTHSLGSKIDRFSVLSLQVMDKIHESFTAEELLRVELLPQNSEADARHKKANVGRANDFSGERAHELASGSLGSTTACVSGFLINMVDGTIQLVTPCAASERWPMGFWVLDRGRFGSPEGLGEIVESMIARNMTQHLGIGDRVTLRPDITIIGGKKGELRLVSQLTLPIREQPKADHLADLLRKGSYTTEQLALLREQEAGVPLEETIFLLQDLFEKGVLDEEPAHGYGEHS